MSESVTSGTSGGNSDCKTLLPLISPAKASSHHPLARRRRIILIGLAGIGLLCLSSFIWFYTHHSQQGSLHHISGVISKQDHDLFLKLGVACEETYEVEGYEGPEGILRRFSLTQHQYRDLNPGSSMNPEKGTRVCVRGMFGVTADHASQVFTWFWPLTAAACAFLGFLASQMMTWLSKPQELGKAPLSPV